MPPPGVLIVDDDEAICFSLVREVRRQGHPVYVAADGLDALERYHAAAGAIGIAFLDVRMPRLNGLEALAALCRLDPTLRCCLMTAYGRPLQLPSGLANIHILEKPFDLEQFVQVLNALSEQLRVPRTTETAS